MSKIRKKDILYLKSLSSFAFEDAKEFKELGLSKDIPIVQDDVGEFLYLLIKLYKPKKILEIGFGGGYSSLWISKGLRADGNLTSLDVSKERVEAGRRLFSNHKNVNIENVDGLKFLEGKKSEYDLVFLDAIKKDYPSYLDLITKALKPGGVLVADNILFQAQVVSNRPLKRYKEGALGMRKFNNMLKESASFESIFLAIGDGLCLSLKQ